MPSRVRLHCWCSCGHHLAGYLHSLFSPLALQLFSCPSPPRFLHLPPILNLPSSSSYLRSCQSGLPRCLFILSGWGTRPDQPWTLIDLSGEMTATSEDAYRQVHVMWQRSFIPPPPPQLQPPPAPTFLHFPSLGKINIHKLEECTRDEHVSWRVGGKFSFEPELMWCSHVMKFGVMSAAVSAYDLHKM